MRAPPDGQTLPASLPALALRLGPGAVAGVVLFSLVINLTLLAAPLYMLQVYDRVLASGSIPTLALLTLVTLGIMAASAGLEFYRAQVLSRLALRFDLTWSEPLLRRLLRSVGARARARTHQPLRDIESVRALLCGHAILAVLDAPFVPIFLVVLFALHPLLGVLGLVAALSLVAIALGTELATAASIRQASGASSHAHRLVENAERNALVVSAMGMMDSIARRWSDVHVQALAANERATDRKDAFRALTKFVRPGLQTGVLGLGAFLAVRGEISAGSIVAASIVLGRTLAPIEMAVGSWRELVIGRQAYARLREAATTFLKAPEGRISLPAPEGRLQAENLVVPGREGQPPVLDRISFALAPGEALGLVGASGAGKTTLLNLLAGVWQPARGSVRLDDAELGQWDAADLGRHIGYLPQEIGLFDVTVAENICRLGTADPEEIVRAARAAGAHEMILRLPDGYGTRAGEGGASLSAGQRQRVGLARALYGRPRLILLDEPNAHLDARGEDLLRQTIRKLKEEGCTIVIAMHGKGLLAFVDHVLELEDGRCKRFVPRAEYEAPTPPETPRRPRTVVPLSERRAARRMRRAAS
ncbi:MAG: type I secretion system permease/ATPase [Alphaproteobacteria bacterium]|nr:type I secretion system permease/ATPase [Alphaproteobacteria bacterium]